MKANELMIGDWVQGFVPDTYSRVEAIPNENRLGVISSGGHYIASVADDFQPIPLTPEILEKNGWKHKYYDVYQQTIGETITIDIFPEGCSIVDSRGSQRFWFRYHLPSLKFVHELQHAMRLCGIEKEIEL